MMYQPHTDHAHRYQWSRSRTELSAQSTRARREGETAPLPHAAKDAPYLSQLVVVSCCGIERRARDHKDRITTTKPTIIILSAATV
jgi:hypothetical protein